MCETLETENKEGKKKVPLGVIVVSAINFVFGSAGIFLGLVGLPVQPTLSLYAFVTALILLSSGIGMLELKCWAWYLAVLACIVSLATYPLLPSQGFIVPLEIVVLPYLLSKRGTFGIKLTG